MPDISMCMNDECHLAKECYRHEATPSDWQSFGYFRPNEVGGCDHFLPIWTSKNKVATNPDTANHNLQNPAVDGELQNKKVKQ